MWLYGDEFGSYGCYTSKRKSLKLDPNTGFFPRSVNKNPICLNRLRDLIRNGSCTLKTLDSDREFSSAVLTLQ